MKTSSVVVRPLVAAAFFVGFAVLFCAALAAAELPGPALRIINGTPASPSAYPFMASLSVRGSAPGRGHFCGGALIRRDVVLTAAHCVIDHLSDPGRLQVTVGRSRLSAVDQGATVRVSSVTVFPSYVADTTTNDVAIVRLERPVDVPVAPVVRPDEAAACAPGAPARLLGWGSLDETFPVRPDDLREAVVPVQSDATCAAAMGIDFNPGVMLCAGKLATTVSSADGVDTCFGDSGGPLLVETPDGLKIGGVASWGFGCGRPNFYGVYTRITSFSDWIGKLPGVIPVPVEPPAVDGEPAVGSLLACSRGVWQGADDARFTYRWIDADTGVVRAAGKSRYRVREGDLGGLLRCEVSATNRSGAAVASSEAVGPVGAPSSRRFSKERGAFVKRAGLYCSGRNCTLYVGVSSEQVARVSAKIETTLPHCAVRTRRSCVTTAAKRANKVGAKTWAFRLKRLRGASYVVSATAYYPGGDGREKSRFRLG